jgi:hypothetical protein
MQCQGHVIDTYSQSGQVVLPNSTSLIANRCNLMIFRDFEQSLQAESLWPTFGANAQLGPTSGASFYARNCTIQYNHMVCPLRTGAHRRTVAENVSLLHVDMTGLPLVGPWVRRVRHCHCGSGRALPFGLEGTRMGRARS